ncbi:hypothetical protein I8751_22810 [Nostocaceae cyanobacterium CENA357]|uniref:Uncharacterized protein n=1 Tax=Atlanticothrix silvestris CENA357 TaxID=1725252 RepID=A0A8J7L7H9_9CYAN|nr:hypothetical protein [Atlanticothrix silvestris]MBH8555127.1 hypothetical protein [Atlanticothrix silvestris CENA357]
MLAQFQRLYPNGSLTSELVEIFQGKYIVRASVQIAGETRATGMAAAETVEVAEDQARTRALIVLGITSSPPATVFSPKTTSQAQLNPAVNTTAGLNETTFASATDEDFSGTQWSTSNQEISIPPVREQNIQPNLVENDTLKTSNNNTYSQDLNQNFPITNNQESEFETPRENLETTSENQSEIPLFPEISSPSNVTPFTPRSFNQQENVSTLSGVGKKKKKNEPVNLSDVIAKTDVQIERLGWTKDQGREYLKKTYGKLGRSLLSEEELLDFLRYLESQPDPLAGF